MNELLLQQILKTNLIYEKNRIKSVHSSLKIEANCLSMEQVRDIINGKRVMRDKKEIQEVKNAYATYEQLNLIDPYRVQDLKRYHTIMTKNLEKECGEFRSGDEGVF